MRWERLVPDGAGDVRYVVTDCYLALNPYTPEFKGAGHIIEWMQECHSESKPVVLRPRSRLFVSPWQTAYAAARRKSYRSKPCKITRWSVVNMWTSGWNQKQAAPTPSVRGDKRTTALQKCNALSTAVLQKCHRSDNSVTTFLVTKRLTLCWPRCDKSVTKVTGSRERIETGILPSTKNMLTFWHSTIGHMQIICSLSGIPLLVTERANFLAFYFRSPAVNMLSLWQSTFGHRKCYSSGIPLLVTCRELLTLWQSTFGHRKGYSSGILLLVTCRELLTLWQSTLGHRKC
jgi:hypothetical protein